MAEEKKDINSSDSGNGNSIAKSIIADALKKIDAEAEEATEESLDRPKSNKTSDGKSGSTPVLDANAPETVFKRQKPSAGGIVAACVFAVVFLTVFCGVFYMVFGDRQPDASGSSSENTSDISSEVSSSYITSGSYSSGDTSGAHSDKFLLVYTNESDNTLKLTEYTGALPQLLEIPSEVNGFPVTAISDYCFRNNENLTTVIIPDSVKSIGKGCFSGCSSLSELIIYTEAYEYVIPKEMCKGCVSLTYAQLLRPDGGSAQLIVSESAFSGCTALAHIGTEKDISEGTLRLISVGKSAFKDCVGLKYDIRFESSPFVSLYPTEIEVFSDAFLNCASITSVTFDCNVTNIGKNAFADCRELRYAYFYFGLETIDSYAFGACKKMTVVCGIENPKIGVFPENLVSIGEYAFLGCTNLTLLSLPDNLEAIWSYAFCGASFGGGIKLPASLKIIDEGAFSSVTGLGKVVFNGECELKPRAFSASDLSIADLTNWRTKEIPYATFAQCWFLKSVMLPEGLEMIDDEAFCETALSEFIIPPGVTYLGTVALAECKNLERIVMTAGQYDRFNSLMSDWEWLVGPHTEKKITFADKDGNVFGTFGGPDGIIERYE